MNTQSAQGISKVAKVAKEQQQLTDIQLVNRIKACGSCRGCADNAFGQCAFSQLWQRHQASVLKTILQALCNLGDEVDDVLQETMLKAWDSMRNLNPEKTPVVNWLNGIARNTALKTLRRHNTRVRVQAMYEAEYSDSFTMTTPAVYQGGIRDFIAEHAHPLGVSLQGFNDDEKKCVLGFLRTLDVEKVAEKCRTSPAKVSRTVRSWRRKARELLPH